LFSTLTLSVGHWERYPPYKTSLYQSPKVFLKNSENQPLIQTSLEMSIKTEVWCVQAE